MVRFLPFLISLVLSVYALFSCIQTPDEDVPHLPKLVWIVLIVFVPFVGPIVWLLMSRTQGAGGRQETVVRQSPSVSRPLAPDDDPDFLKSLDRYRDPRTTTKPPEPDEPADGHRSQDKPQGKPQDRPKKPKTPSEDLPSETEDGSS